MNNERTLLSRQLTVLTIFTIVGFSFRFLPYWKEQYQGWLMCIWGMNAVMPLFMVSVSKCCSTILGYALPLVGFIVSDLIIQWILIAKGMDTSSIRGRLVTYAIFLVLAQLGLVLKYLKLPKWENVLAGVGLTLAGSILFFIISNGLVWMKSSPSDGQYFYPPTWAGLVECYVQGIPFFRNQLIGDAIFSFAFFSIYLLLEQRYILKAPKPVAVGA
ncbi:MAG TPA: hypothetical protein PLN21_18930 [Gemmatales bacterium]|nr:hypothetical protein [Gemmatales bacterium]